MSKIYKEYSANAEAGEMVDQKNLSPEIIKDFGLCYIPENSKCKTDLIWCRLALPIHDAKGNQIAYAGRKLQSNQDLIQKIYSKKYLNDDLLIKKIDKWEKSKWINEPYDKTKNLYNLNRAWEHILNLNFVIVVEGYFDVMALWNKGVKNVVSPCGTKLSKYQTLLLKSLCDHIYVFYDGDQAGQDGADHAMQICESLNINCKKLTLEKNDPDDYIIKKNGAKFLSFLNDNLNTNIKEIKLI